MGPGEPQVLGEAVLVAGPGGPPALGEAAVLAGLGSHPQLLAEVTPVAGLGIQTLLVVVETLVMAPVSGLGIQSLLVVVKPLVMVEVVGALVLQPPQTLWVHP